MSLDRLKKVAKRATVGPWSSRGAHGTFIRKIKSSSGTICNCDSVHLDEKVITNGIFNAIFIAEFDPEKVLTLIGQIEALRAGLEHHAACFYVGRDCRDVGREDPCHRCSLLIEDDKHSV